MSGVARLTLSIFPGRKVITVQPVIKFSRGRQWGGTRLSPGNAVHKQRMPGNYLSSSTSGDIRISWKAVRDSEYVVAESWKCTGSRGRIEQYCFMYDYQTLSKFLLYYTKTIIELVTSQPSPAQPATLSQA